MDFFDRNQHPQIPHGGSFTAKVHLGSDSYVSFGAPFVKLPDDAAWRLSGPYGLVSTQAERNGWNCEVLSIDEQVLVESRDVDRPGQFYWIKAVTVRITAPADATLGQYSLGLFYFYATGQKHSHDGGGSAVAIPPIYFIQPFNSQERTGSYGQIFTTYKTLQVVCLAAATDYDPPTWNAEIGKWHYSATITLSGGTAPYTVNGSTVAASFTVERDLAPGESTSTPLQTVGDANGCSASYGPVFGPAPDAPTDECPPGQTLDTESGECVDNLTPLDSPPTNPPPRFGNPTDPKCPANSVWNPAIGWCEIVLPGGGHTPVVAPFDGPGYYTHVQSGGATTCEKYADYAAYLAARHITGGPFLTPAACREASGAGASSCPEGSTFNASTGLCEAPPDNGTTCPDGTTLTAGVCTAPPDCGDGFSYNAEVGGCVEDELDGWFCVQHSGATATCVHPGTQSALDALVVSGYTVQGGPFSSALECSASCNPPALEAGQWWCVQSASGEKSCAYQAPATSLVLPTGSIVVSGPHATEAACTTICTNSDNTGGCPQGQFYNPATESCEPLANFDCTLTVPAAPTAPVATINCATPSISVSSGAFPTGATALKLERSSNNGTTWAPVHSYETAGTYIDLAVASPGLYQYRARACNAAGCSDYSAVTSASLTAAIVPVWVAPSPDTEVTGQVLLVAWAGPRAALHATYPVSIRLFGGELPVTYHSAINQWSAPLDTELEYQGTLELVLQARAANGCYSAPVTLHLTLNNSIQRTTRWSELAIAPELSAELVARGENITTVGYYAQLVQRAAKRFFRWYVTSPDPGAATTQQFGDNTYMTNRVQSWQEIAPNTLTRLQTPDTSARLAMQSLPTELLALYHLDDSSALKVRQTADDKIEILTQNGYYEWSDDGLTPIAHFADYQTGAAQIVGNVRDGIKVGDKIYLCRASSPSRVVVLDLIAGKISTQISPFAEERAVRALENWNGTPLAIYGNTTTATGYVLGTSADDAFTLNAAIKSAWVRDGRLFVAAGPTLTSATQLLEISLGTDGTANTTLHAALDTPITAVNLFTSDAETLLEFGDHTGHAYRAETGGPATLASGLGGDLADLSRFKGSAGEPRGVLALGNGPNVARLFLATGGVYTPQWQLRDLQNASANRVVALARVQKPLVAPVGNPLMGGVAGVYAESLVAVFNTPNGAFLARIQEADVDLDKTTLATAINGQNFKVERVGTAVEVVP